MPLSEMEKDRGLEKQERLKKGMRIDDLFLKERGSMI
jgi:hypothetical protein